MPFTVSTEFGDRVFETWDEFQEALKSRDTIEQSLAARAEESDEVARVTATVVPAPKELVNQRVIELEEKVDQLNELIASLQAEKPEMPTENKDGVTIGTVLRGESKGESYTLQVLEEGYLCSDGVIYNTLSAAALGVSGNRRSGWKFWTDVEGKPIGAIVGRFKSHAEDNPFATG